MRDLVDLMTRWPLEDSPEELADWLNNRLSGTLMSPMRIHAVSVSPEGSISELTVSPVISTPTGYVHAGAIVSLADSNATWTVIAALGGDLTSPTGFPVATNISCQLVSNINKGKLVAESKIIHQGRKLITVETRVRNEASLLLALITTTHYVRDRPSGES
ncbi:PaaI family thioesterase [SAR202 cluster bacterium AD-804-J14_MRT_500m]|nr:PaaI family thioesterase [SAR202 cluster bacterium AD-804-J14_MRT_500m]